MTPVKLHRRYRRLSVWNKLFVWGSVASLVGVFLSFLPKKQSQDIHVLAPSPQSVVHTPTDLPLYTISLGPHNTLNRTAYPQDKEWEVGWVILHDGQLQLERRAVGETQYKHFRTEPGTYSAYIKVLYHGEYRIASNVVSYTLP